MTLVVEDGSGLLSANSYCDAEFVDLYFSSRGISTWTGDTSVKEAALIKATDYIETRFGHRFGGARLHSTVGAARGTLTFTVQPTSGQTVTVDGQTFTFGSNVTIDSRLSVTISNLIDAINDNTLTEVSAYALAGQKLYVIAGYDGPDGNDITVSTNITGASWSSATLLGGNDELSPQGLSFPRSHLYVDGNLISGIPTDLKKAVAEYALRSLSSTLMPDPARDDTGGEVLLKREEVGPIKEETRYSQGQLNTIPNYPAADKLLSKFLVSGGLGGVIR